MNEIRKKEIITQTLYHVYFVDELLKETFEL